MARAHEPVHEDDRVHAVRVRAGLAREQRRVLRSRWQKGRVFLALDGVERVEAAETLRGELLEVAADDVPDFADGEYYLDDVAGCEVFTDTGEALGRVGPDRTSGGVSLHTLNS